MSDERKPREEQPETALEEALKEMSDAAHRTGDPERCRGEAGEGVTPNTRAQEESEGE